LLRRRVQSWRHLPRKRRSIRRLPHVVYDTERHCWCHVAVWSPFPSIRSKRKPLSENAFNSALRRMGYEQDEMTAHGFRSTASTILNERGYNPDVIEAALGHQDEDEIRRAYNRAKYWPERVKLMQDWADLLDQFRSAKLS
jgi:integrase